MDGGGKGGGGKGGSSKGGGRGAAEAGDGGSVAHRRRRRRRRTWPRRAQPAHLQSAGARAAADTCSCPALSRAGAVGDGASEGTEPSYSSDSSCTRSSPDCHSPPSLSSLDFAPFSLSVSSSATSDDVDLSSPDVACSWQAAPSALGPAPLEEAPGSAGWSAPRGRTGRGGDGALGSIVVSKILAPGEPYRPLLPAQLMGTCIHESGYRRLGAAQAEGHSVRIM